MIPYVDAPDVTIYHGEALEVLRGLRDKSASACVTSPPYLDARPEYDGPTMVEHVAIFTELRRVVSGGALVNVGRLFRGGREKLWWLDLLEAARLAGWGHLDTLVWFKPNANPIHGRVVANSHEYVLVLGDDSTAFNTDAVRTEYAPSSIPRLQRRWINGRGVKGDDRELQHGRRVNPLGARARSVFVYHVGREKGNPHPAPMALETAEHLVALASWPGQIVLDPFAGSGTTGLAARRLGRGSVLIDRRHDYCEQAAQRLSQVALLVPGQMSVEECIAETEAA